MGARSWEIGARSTEQRDRSSEMGAGSWRSDVRRSAAFIKITASQGGGGRKPCGETLRSEDRGRRTEQRDRRSEDGGQKSGAENHFCAERSDAPGFFAEPEFDARRIVRVRSRSASSIRNFSAIGRSASPFRKARLLCSMLGRSCFIFILRIVARTAAKRYSNHDAPGFLAAG